MNEASELTGYLHPLYADSLKEFGAPRQLPRSGAWILQRQIPGFPYYDAMGCYPLFSCQDWSELRNDLEGIQDELVSLSVVTDPFGTCDFSYLRACFKNLVLPYKQHFIVDLGPQMSSFVSEHHCHRARNALRKVSVRICQSPTQYIDDWFKLYGTLIKRHDIKGIACFSRSSFMKQFAVPGLVMFRAVFQEESVGMTLWYVQGDSAYWHLGAYSDTGYKLRASFALVWSAIEFFTAKGLRRLDLGAGAGVHSNSDDGLAQFKRGWSTRTQTAHLCGRIFDRQRYFGIVKAKNISATDYFPAYRKGEYG